MRDFDRPAVQLHVGLLDRQFLAGGRADHQLDEIEAGDQLRHRMLDLQPRVHLEEVEIAILVDDELDGAGAVVADGLCQRDRLLAHRLARFRIEERRRRLLDHLLMAALDRAFAFVEIDDVAVLVADHLDFDVARLGDEFLDEQAVVAEAGACASCCEDWIACTSSLSLWTMRRPLPPPPADAFTITG